MRSLCLLAQFARTEADHHCLLHLIPGDAIPREWHSTFALYEWASRREHIVVYGEHTRRFDVLPASKSEEPQDDDRWSRAVWREIEARWREQEQQA